MRWSSIVMVGMVGFGVFTARSASAQLVINEIDYDQILTDTQEYVEIKNVSAAPVPLAGLALVFINGANSTEYRRVDISMVSATLMPGQYLVVRSSNVVPAQGSLSVILPGASDQIQNGSPDGVALINTVSLTVLDSLSYEGSIVAATIVGFPAPVNLVQGTFTSQLDSNSIVGSLVRFPDGRRTGDDASDWVFTASPSPGASNGGCASPPGDADGDGAVGLSDIAVLVGHWGQSVPPAPASADLDGDGAIGLGDIAVVVSNWGEVCG